VILAWTWIERKEMILLVAAAAPERLLRQPLIEGRSREISADWRLPRVRGDSI
jgi:hypothetical protein